MIFISRRHSSRDPGEKGEPDVVRRLWTALIATERGGGTFGANAESTTRCRWERVRLRKFGLGESALLAADRREPSRVDQHRAAPGVVSLSQPGFPSARRGVTRAARRSGQSDARLTQSMGFPRLQTGQASNGCAILGEAGS